MPTPEILTSTIPFRLLSTQSKLFLAYPCRREKRTLTRSSEQQPTDSQATSQRPTPQNEEFAVSAEEGAISTPSKPTASPGSAAATTTTPPFWPTSPFPRQRSGSTTPLSPLQRRRTVDETPVRQQNLRRSSDQTQQPTSYENHQIVSPSHQQKTRHQILGSGQQPRPSGSLEAEQRSPRPLQQTRRASAQPTRQERLSGPSHVGWEVRYRSPVREVHESPGRQSRRTSDQGKGSPGVHGKGSGSGG